MKTLMIAGLLALAGGQAGAVAVGSASGSVSVTITGDDADRLDAVFLLGTGAPNPLAETDVLFELVEAPGAFTLTPTIDWPDDTLPALPFDGDAAISAAADGGPVGSGGFATGLGFGVFDALIDIENNSGDVVGFGLEIVYSLSASASAVGPNDDALSSASVEIDFLAPDGADPDPIEDEVFADALLGPFSASVDQETILVTGLSLADGEFFGLDILLDLSAEATAVAPIPVPPAMALLPAGLALLAAAGRRSRGG